MSKKLHEDDELRPPPGALQALDAWLDANGLRRSALAPVLMTHQVQIHRIFAGTGYLSATQRRAVEKFTQGAITLASLEGKVLPPPSKAQASRRAPVEAPAESAEPTSAPRPRTTEEAERIVDDLTARAMPAAFKVILEQMVKGKSESERRRCAEILIEHLRGKAKQYERREKLEPPATDDELISVFDRIKNNLGGGNGDRPVPHVPGGASGDDFGGEGLA